TFASPRSSRIVALSLSNTGRHLVGEFDDGSGPYTLICWDTQTGKSESDVADWTTDEDRPGEGRTLITGEWQPWIYDGCIPKCADLNQPLKITFDPYDLIDKPSRRLLFSPSGRA